MSKPATITDVARLAGVSITTVSRILNNKPDVAQATRQRVLDAIQQLNFTPHVQAQRLAAGKSQSIAVLYPSDSLGFTELEFEFFVGASQVATKAGFLFNLIVTPMNEQTLLNLYRSNQVDGVILMEVHLNDRRVAVLRERGYPFVLIGRCTENTGLSTIDLDFETAMLLACEHLYSLGHRHIGFTNLIGARAGYGPAIRSLWGYQRACEQFGIEPIYRELKPTIDELYRATEALLDEQPGMTAMITLHTGPLVGAIRAAQNRGLCVPDQFSIVGILSDQMAQFISPPLTAISFPAQLMGSRAAQMLIRKLQDADYEDKQVLLKPRLVIRDSTAPARTSER
ncbi:MAG: LacI family DNA-binding transcriptional regulator [Chloroflexi bacterium]|nr:LacI family DNA-binding transcriptional regulator [Chloroflexota bacterium]